MRKTVALLLAAAFVAALPSMASAKKAKRSKQAPVATQTAPQGTGNLVTDALHQIVVPFEVTFGGRR